MSARLDQVPYDALTRRTPVESYCVPNFDSPSIFARIVDKDKGGHFSITPTVPFTTKQNYLPSSNVLQTKCVRCDPLRRGRGLTMALCTGL